jgi:hypothetical protein
MSAPLTDLPLSSISASGLVDGLGRRVLAFDRETGVMLERLVLRPELAAFEAAIKLRVDLLAGIDDERFARPGTVQRDRETGDLAVVSEFVAGSRLSDIIEAAEEAGLVPGVDVALGFLLEALPAISTFHNVTGFAHGLIEPSRLLITPGAGQVVFLDPSFGSVVERLGLSRHRLWAELGIAGTASAGPVRLDPATDVSQLVLCALMLVIGRRLREHEYPDALPSLLNDVLEIAQIRGSNLFATSLDRLFQRSLPVASRKPFGSADEFANEIRLLLRREIGVDVCRQALLDFVAQMDAAAEDHDGALASHSGNGHDTAGLDNELLDSMSFEVLDDGGDAESEEMLEEDSDDEEYSEVSLDADRFGEPVTERESNPESIAAADYSSERAEDTSSSEEFAASSETFASADAETGLDEFPPLDPETLPPGHDVISSDSDDSDSDASAAYDSDAAASGSAESESNSVAARRRKRQNKSARARKDKLRSSAKPQPAPQPAPKPQPQPPPQPQAEQKPATSSGWLVSPDRAAAFTPAVPDPPRPQPPAAAAAPPPPNVTPPMPQHPAVAIPAPLPVTPPIARPVPMPVYTPVQPSAAPPIIQAPPPNAPLPQLKQPAPAGGPVRLKNEPPAGYTPPRASEPIAPTPYASMSRPVFQQAEEEAPSRFPWKLAAAAVVFVAIAVVAGRAYMLSGKKDGEATTASTTVAAPVEPPPVTPSKVESGDVTIETQPSGARVLLDGKPVGTSPLKLAGVPAGRHTLTFMSPSGEVSRTVKVAAGKTLEVDVSIFSGWLAVFAPVVLDISVGGKSIGTTEQSRLMIPPGRHELTLTNKEFGYRAVQEVTVEPGEVRSITIDPRGDANFNAIPWAEVWMDGQKLGDTPMANTRVPLGTREFVFKHPQYGERRITAIIRADQATPVSIDFTKSQKP